MSCNYLIDFEAKNKKKTVQAGLFYLPRYIWYGWEGGQMMNMIGTLAKQPNFFIDAEPDNCGIIELVKSENICRLPKINVVLFHNFIYLYTSFRTQAQIV